MKTIVIGIVLALLLSSCGPRGSHSWYRGADRLERRDFVKEVCRDYGYKDYSDMTDCIATEMRDRKEAAQRNKEEIADSLTRALDGFGNSMGNRVTCQNYGSVTNCRQY
jgi:hypothetical protein